MTFQRLLKMLLPSSLIFQNRHLPNSTFPSFPIITFSKIETKYVKVDVVIFHAPILTADTSKNA